MLKKTLIFHLSFLLLLAACAPDRSAIVSISPSELTDAGAIVGGKEASAQHLAEKYLVMIYDNATETYCTGMLIRKDVVLTAAHCIKSEPAQLSLAFGRRPLSGNYQLRRVSKTLVHPAFKPGNQKLNRSDIALIKISGFAPEGYGALTIPAPEFPLKKGYAFTAAGFGRLTGLIDPTGKDLQGSGILRYVDLTIASLSDDETQFFVDQTKGKGICNGDSGGPALMRYNGKDYVVGIASAISWTGEQTQDVCSQESIYISLKKFYPWLSNELAKF